MRLRLVVTLWLRHVGLPGGVWTLERSHSTQSVPVSSGQTRDLNITTTTTSTSTGTQHPSHLTPATVPSHIYLIFLADLSCDLYVEIKYQNDILCIHAALLLPSPP